jgi:2-keto-3-deoxy-6-phosphogluconate aldolase
MSNGEGQPVWNTAMPVIALIAAATAEEAEQKLAEALQKAGFTLYEAGDQDYNTFRSEDGVEPNL